MPHKIKSIDPSKKLAGRIWTCSGEIDETIDKDTSMLSWTEMLSKAPSDSVVICQPNDDTIAHMGELSAETLKYKGVKGYIVDGGCRDVDFILKLGFPVFCKYFTPSDVVCRWKITSLGEPIKIGTLNIKSGDYVLGDIDGVVIIPQDIAESVVSETEDYMNTESQLRKADYTHERYNIRTNLDMKLNDNLTAQVDMSYFQTTLDKAHFDNQNF